jgi:hypothetical protein
LTVPGYSWEKFAIETRVKIMPKPNKEKEINEVQKTLKNKTKPHHMPGKYWLF